MHKRNFFLAGLAAAPALAYSLLFFGMMVEGDLFVFTAGFLAHHHALNPFIAFPVALAGCVIGDALWYLLGRVDTERNKFLGWLGRAADKLGGRIDAHLKQRTFHTLFLSKFVYGAHHFTLVRAGRSDVPLLKIVRSDIPASFFWIAIVGAFGYLASASFEILRHRLHYIELALLLAVALYFLAAELVSRFLKSRL
jgi:membrane protein DedA with SNARE-associated domain